ncbi:hypothetical protein [Reichenbachiella sp. MALMAid0571]|uniref:hypothetical protein n=1 Tax=Reichenbachiella sp. MALMAid0571 TaxID=3143939 RepID=UPI0032DF8CD1
MNKLNIFFALILTIILHGCGDDEPSIKFNGITETDNQGVQIGSVDETDWQHDEIWSNMEIALFSKYENLNNDGVPEQTSNAVWYAFPNPTNKIVAIHLANLEYIEFAEWKLVKDDFSVLTGTSFSNAPGGLQIDLGTLASSGIYRMYYLYKFQGNGTATFDRTVS